MKYILSFVAFSTCHCHYLLYFKNMSIFSKLNSSSKVWKFLRQRENNMILKSEGNHLVFSKEVLGRLKKPNLINKSLQGYFHSLISSHTLKILLHRQCKTAGQMWGFLRILSNWGCFCAKQWTEWLPPGHWHLVEIFQRPGAETASSSVSASWPQ